MAKGVLYIAAESAFRREASRSAASVKRHNPNLGTTLITDAAEDVPNFDTVRVMDNPRRNFADKVFEMCLPYDQTLYLDTDTYVCEDLTCLFELLTEFDVAAAHNSNRDIHSYTIGDIPDSFPEYNTGVIGLADTDPVRSFLSRWIDTYDADGTEKWPPDQPSFRAALYESDLRLATLPPEYNYVIRNPGHAVDELKIVHSRLIDLKTEGADKYLGFDVPEAAERLNEIDGHRLHYGMHELHIKTKPWDPLWVRALVSFRHNGIFSTLRRGVRKAISSI
jgi:hypothetical protein